MSVKYEVNWHYPLPVILGMMSAIEKLGNQGNGILHPPPGRIRSIRSAFQQYSEYLMLELGEKQANEKLDLLKKRTEYPILIRPNQEVDYLNWLIDNGDISILKGNPVINFSEIPDDFPKVRNQYLFKVPLFSIYSYGTAGTDNYTLVKTEAPGKYRDWDFIDLVKHLKINKKNKSSPAKRQGRQYHDG